MIIPTSDLTAAAWIVDETGLAATLRQATHPTKMGRPSKWDSDRLLWIGLILATLHRGQTHTRAIYKALQSLSFDDQVDIGFAYMTRHPRTGKVEAKKMSRSILENTWKRYNKWLAYGKASGVDKDERQTRYDLIMDVVYRSLEPFHHLFATGSAAIDSTGSWAWARGYKDGSRVDQDAEWGSKTSKSGRTESVFGYHVHAAAAIANKPKAGFAPAPVILGFDITPANLKGGVAKPTIAMIDRIGDLTEVVVDRLYSDSKAHKWYDKLRLRGIKQVADLKKTDHGFSDVDGMYVGVGFVHCPGVPTQLLDIEPPTPPASSGTDKKTRKVQKAEKKARAKYKAQYKNYTARVEERQQYVMPYNEPPTGKQGKCRVECPAKTGKVACPLRPETFRQAIMKGAPTVESPPNPNDHDFPSCCKPDQRTVTIKISTKRKHVQSSYHGTQEWIDSNNRRSLIEGVFGILKNPGREDLRRGNHRATNITRAVLQMLGIVLAYNLKAVRGWYEKNHKRRERRTRDVVDQLRSGPFLTDPADDEKLPMSLSPEEVGRILQARDTTAA